MMRIHVSVGAKRRRYKVGDTRVIKGIKHKAIARRINVGTERNPRMSYDCTGGRQRIDWVPVEGAVTE